MGPRSSIYNWNCRAFRSPHLLEVWVLLVGRNVATLAAAVEELSGLKAQVEKHGGSGGFVDGKKRVENVKSTTDGIWSLIGTTHIYIYTFVYLHI